MSLVLPVSKCC